MKRGRAGLEQGPVRTSGERHSEPPAASRLGEVLCAIERFLLDESWPSSYIPETDGIVTIVCAVQECSSLRR